MGCVLFTISLKKYIPQRQTKKVFKSIRDVPSAFNNVSTVTDYNFKATELKVIPQYCIANTYCARFLRHWRPYARPNMTKHQVYQLFMSTKNLHIESYIFMSS